MELDHFKPFPFIKFQNFLQPWLPRIFGNKSPGVEFKSVGVRVKSVGVEFEILLTCLGCGYAMLFKLSQGPSVKKVVPSEIFSTAKRCLPLVSMICGLSENAPYII